MNQQGSRSPRLTKEEKAQLRRQLPALIESATTSTEARTAALKACLATQYPVPPTLIDAAVLATSLAGQELLAALSRLTTSTVIRDLSPVLVALRTRLDRELASGGSSAQKLIRVATTIPQKVLRLVAPERKPQHQKRSPVPIFITAPTIAAFADLAGWTIRAARAAQSRRPPEPRRLVVPWIAAVDALWQRTQGEADGRVLAEFWRDVSLALGSPAAETLKSDPKVVAFAAQKREAVRLTATTAFQQGRLETLRSLEALLANEGTEWKDLLKHLRSVRESAGSAIPEPSVDWLARISEDQNRHQLTAADESQSGALDYAAGALLAAWDAMNEGPRSREAFEAVRSMVQELFKLEIIGIPGEVVPFDELEHDVSGSAASGPVTVKLVRPAIRWSDGVRRRTVVRATGEAI